MTALPAEVIYSHAVESRRWSFPVRLWLAPVIGVLLALTFPPFGLVWLAVPVVAAVTLLVRGLSGPRAAAIGLAVGMGFFLLLLRWMLVIGPDAWILLSLLEALFVAAMAAGLAVVQRLPAWPLWTAALWVAQELARSRVPFGGFPWGRLAFAQDASPFTAVAALGGSPLVTFAVALSGSLLAWGVVSVAGRRWLTAGAGVLAALAVALAGLLVPLPTQGRTVTAAVVQGNVPRAGLDFMGQREAVLRNHVATTMTLAGQVKAGTRPQPELVVWPENSSDLDPYRDAGAKALIQTAVDAIAAPTLVGAVVQNPANPDTLLNLGIVWSPVSGPGQTYAKRHPVPFGEYVPFRSELTRFITRFNRIPYDFAAGDRPGVLTVGPATVGDAICFEVAYDPIIRDTVTGGADILVVQTNNATYGRTGQPEQQLAMSRLRAVEFGRTVLIAATSGISAVVAPDGRLVARSAEFERWTYDGPVVLRTEQTLAARVGAWPEWILGTLGVVAAVLATARTRRERSPHTDDRTIAG